MSCKNCGSPFHESWNCVYPKGGREVKKITVSHLKAEGDLVTKMAKAAAKKPGRKKSTAARKNVQTPARHGTQMPEGRAPVSAPTVDASQATAGTQAPPVDTPKRGPGRPSTGFDKKAYDLEYARKRRAAVREKGK